MSKEILSGLAILSIENEILQKFENKNLTKKYKNDFKLKKKKSSFKGPI
jgi:hypothetical protein